MTTYELNQDQMISLKQSYICERFEQDYNETPSWGVLADADELVPDDIIHDYYSGTDFVEDDFGC